MTDPGQLVRSYLEIIASREVEDDRAYLADTDFSYTSPIGNQDNADRLIEDTARFAPIMDSMTIRKLVVDGEDVVVVVDVGIALQEYMNRTAALIFTVKDERIQTIEAIFNASEYFKLFELDE